MKALKQESEAIQQIVRETMALLELAYEKLTEVYDSDGRMQVNTLVAGQCVIHAECAIEAAAAWLNSDHGEERDCMMLYAPEDYHESFTFEF